VRHGNREFLQDCHQPMAGPSHSVIGYWKSYLKQNQERGSSKHISKCIWNLRVLSARSYIFRLQLAKRHQIWPNTWPHNKKNCVLHIWGFLNYPFIHFTHPWLLPIYLFYPFFFSTNFGIFSICEFSHNRLKNICGRLLTYF
jgi:hypothetical protein